MKKIILGLMLMISALTIKAQCDWSKVYLAYGNTCNSYKFEIAGTVDSCYLTRTIITNRSTLHKDTFYGRGFSVTFADTGKYNVFVKVYNKCLMCDTGFEKLIYVTCKPTNTNKCDWSKIGFYYYEMNCNKFEFQVSSPDTCLLYTTWRYNHKTKKLDTISHSRSFVNTMDTGTYTFKTSYHNKCTGCDTFIYKEMHITCDSNTTRIIELHKGILHLHPNPADREIQFCWSGKSTEYRIFNSNGKLISFGKTESNFKIETRNWTNGIYFIQIGKEAQRFIIQH